MYRIPSGVLVLNSSRLGSEADSKAMGKPRPLNSMLFSCCVPRIHKPISLFWHNTFAISHASSIIRLNTPICFPNQIDTENNATHTHAQAKLKVTVTSHPPYLHTRKIDQRQQQSQPTDLPGNAPPLNQPTTNGSAEQGSNDKQEQALESISNIVFASLIQP